MNDCPTLFDVPPRPIVDIPLSVRHSDPATSHDAARDNAPRRRGQQTRILSAFAHLGEEGGTDADIASLVGLPANTCATRRKELQSLGLIERTEERRRTPSGSTAFVSRVTAAGYAEAMGIAS